MRLVCAVEDDQPVSLVLVLVLAVAKREDGVVYGTATARRSPSGG